jgi:hypothetical protein
MPSIKKPIWQLTFLVLGISFQYWLLGVAPRLAIALVIASIWWEFNRQNRELYKLRSIQMRHDVLLHNLAWKNGIDDQSAIFKYVKYHAENTESSSADEFVTEACAVSNYGRVAREAYNKCHEDGGAALKEEFEKRGIV